MDSFDLKFGKTNVILSFHILRKITTLFRFIELSFFLIIIVSKFSVHLPIAFEISVTGDFLRQVFAVTSISPGFVFLLGNAIVFLLFLNSGQFSSDRDNTQSCNIKADMCMENCEKYSLCEETKAISDVYSRKGRRKIQRSYSAKMKRMDYEDGGVGGRKLSRSVTEVCRRGEKSPENCYYSADEMSSEEFRRTVESFIERRRRTLREEEYSTIVY